VLAGCAGTRVEQTKPTPELPAAWSEAKSDGERVTVADWWKVFRDPSLDHLVQEALARNLDVAAAVARVDEARAVLAYTDASRLPYVDLTGLGDRTRTSQSTTMRQPAGTPAISNNVRLSLNASYEIDLWDRLRNTSEAARAELLAAEAARNTVRIAVASQVAQSYFALRALDAQIETTRRSIAVRERSLELQRKRVELGVLAELDLRQLEAEIAAVRAQLAPMEGSRTREEAALAVVLGRSPRAIMAEVVSAQSGSELALLAPVVPAGLPSELLLRRPDIAEAEQQLAAANARVAIARVSYFPSISLTGYLGRESSTLGNLFAGPAAVWQLAAALTQPIFAGGAIQAEVDAAEARERQALARYQSVIQTAFKDVRSALASQTQARASYDAEQARLTALQDTVRLARLRYEGGLASQLEVLDAERGLLAAELNRTEALRAQRTAIASLMQALGGGWE
jgi:outer membrane protein, multidrug efflux system